MRVERSKFQSYDVYLKDKSRPPSRGGNCRAWHQHVITIDGEKYSFLAAWSGKFVYRNETISFNWECDKSGKYRNVDVTSVVACSKAGNEIIRGDRSGKKWRTADNRLPARRSEWKD
ncbi:hypothetical protein GOB80_11705 [Acetobacter ghanensis]|uniref:Uncharacterized protein n=1 Tax=Acetobacter ghanensis TaxID=431306 RepID=A0ABX0KLC3_9PROT|nr:hypothetical protein [Acetobacter ghanensis]NHO40333.1 hypothetical protein [Acetobacter ghanensis]